MLKVALTGSIGMGKSTVGAMLTAMGVPLFDADATVHRIYQRGGQAVEPLRAVFPEAIVDGQVDRTILSKLVLNNPDAIRRLESVVHPLVGEARQAFLDAAERQGAAFVILDIPLLFEGGGEKRVDRVIVVSAPAEVQRARVMLRPGMTDEKFAAILARQVPDEEKRRRADFVIDTGIPLEQTEEQLRRVVAQLEALAGGQNNNA